MDTRAGAAATLAGRTFGPPVVDYLLIGGGLSLLFTGAVVLGRGHGPIIGWETLPYFLLRSAAAHFAASTVRLYTKPDSLRALPFLTLAFPLVSLVVLTICIADAPRLGPHFQSLYLTWSPWRRSRRCCSTPSSGGRGADPCR